MKELLEILEQAFQYQQRDIACALATIVAIEGSGYRRKGTRMLIAANSQYAGAVSGGCVEKEVALQAQKVFECQGPQLMVYDGRYRLGCEGTLFILIEQIKINQATIEAFRKHYEQRSRVEMVTYFKVEDEQDENCGSTLYLENKSFSLQDRSLYSKLKSADYQIFKQYLTPAKSLYIFGAEHDSVKLCEVANTAGWDVTVICHPLNSKDGAHFPAAKRLIHLLPEEIDTLSFDPHTAAVFMSHSFSRDLAYLLQLISKEPLFYIGLLGPVKRREQLMNHIIEQCPTISDTVLDTIHGPVGLDIGAETPGEIAISILAELQSVYTQTQVISLSRKQNFIHKR